MEDSGRKQCQPDGLSPAERAASLVSKVRAACRRLGLEGRRLLLAVSGGADSLAMLLAIRELSPELGIELRVATLDHQLRAGSAEDARWVFEQCERLRVPCVLERLELAPRGNREQAARRARYGALRRIAGPDAVVATAHTRDDQVETVLLRLGRGAGTRGLRGILERRGSLVRPMLEVSRAEVAAYLLSHGAEPRVDPTNASLSLARNRVRHQVLPALAAALGPEALACIARSAQVCADDERLLERMARRHARAILELSGSGRVEGEARALATLPIALRRRVLRLAAAAAAPEAARRATTGALAAVHHRAIEAALAAGTPAQVALPGGMRFEVRYGRFWLDCAGGAEPAGARRRPAAGFEHVVPGPGLFEFAQGRLEVVSVTRLARGAPASPPPAPPPTGPEAAQARPRPLELLIDPARVALPLLLRSRHPGDRFRPRGGHAKKLKAFLIDKKVPREERDRLALLADSAGRVLCIFGLAGSDAAAEGERVDAPWQVRFEPAASAAQEGRLELAQPGVGGPQVSVGTARKPRGTPVHRRGK